MSRLFPIMGYWSDKQWKDVKGTGIPWEMIAPHEKQAMSNHGGQTLERLAQRGGLSPDEAIAVLNNEPWRRMDMDEARTELLKRADTWASP